MDSGSGDSDEDAQAWEVESEWSELDHIINLADMSDEEENGISRLETHASRLRMKQMSRELVKLYGSISAVALFRSSQHGSLFDYQMF